MNSQDPFLHPIPQAMADLILNSTDFLDKPRSQSLVVLDLFLSVSQCWRQTWYVIWCAIRCPKVFAVGLAGWEGLICLQHNVLLREMCVCSCRSRFVHLKVLEGL